MSERLLKDSFLYGIADFFSKGVAALLFPLFTRYLSVSDFGILALITVLSSLVSMFMEFGINNAIQLLYYEKEHESSKKNLVSSGLLLQTVLGILFVFLFLSLLYPIKDLLLERYQIKFEWIVLSMLITIPNLLIKYCLNITRLHYKPLVFGILSLFLNLLWMFLAIFLMSNYETGINGYFVANLVMLLFILPFAIYSIKIDIDFTIQRSLIREISTLGFPFIFSNLAFWLFGSIDRWILAEYSDTVQVGLYSVAFKIAVVVSMINSAFAQAWSPVLLKIFNEDMNKGIEYIERISKYYLSVLSFVCIGITFFSKELLMIMTPEPYWEASSCVGFISFAIFINGTTQFTMIGISIKKKTLLINYASWIAVAANIIVNIFFSRLFGAIGASLAMVITYLFLSFFYNYYSKSAINYSLSANAFLIPSLLIITANLYIFFINYDYLNWISIFFKMVIILLLFFFLVKFNNLKLSKLIPFRFQ